MTRSGEAEHHPWCEDVVAPQPDREHHLDNLEIASILYDAWSNYMNAFAAGDLGTRPTVRSMTVRFDREVFAGDRLRCGVRCAGRSRRAFTLEQTLWRYGGMADGAREVLDVGTVVLVSVDPETWQPTEIPDAFWARIEGAEGRHIPVG